MKQVTFVGFRRDNRPPNWKTAKSRTKNAWEPHVALGTVFENHCSIGNNTPANDATTLAMIKPRKHQRLADTLLQSGVVTIAFSVL